MLPTVMDGCVSFFHELSKKENGIEICADSIKKLSENFVSSGFIHSKGTKMCWNYAFVEKFWYIELEMFRILHFFLEDRTGLIFHAFLNKKRLYTL